MEWWALLLRRTAVGVLRHRWGLVQALAIGAMVAAAFCLGDWWGVNQPPLPGVTP